MPLYRLPLAAEFEPVTGVGEPVTDEPIFEFDLGNRLALVPCAHDIGPRDPPVPEATALTREPRIALAEPVNAALENLYPVVFCLFPAAQFIPETPEKPGVVGDINGVGIERKNLAVESLINRAVNDSPGYRRD